MSSREKDEESDGECKTEDMDWTLCILDVVAFHATGEDCQAFFVGIVQELKHNGIIVSDVTLSELKESTAQVKVKLVEVSECSISRKLLVHKFPNAKNI